MLFPNGDRYRGVPLYSGMQEWVIQIPSIPILVSVLFPSLHLKYFRIKFLLLVAVHSEVPEGITEGARLNVTFTINFTHKYNYIPRCRRSLKR